MGSYSPDGIGLVSVGGVYAGGRTDRERERRSVDRDRELSRGRDRTGKRLSHGLSPDDPPAASSQVLSRAAHDTPQVNVVIPADEAPPIPNSAADEGKAEETQRYPTPTPSNSPVVSMQYIPAAVTCSVAASNTLTSPKGRSPPLTVPAPHPAEPSTSYSISPPGTSAIPVSPSPMSPTNITKGEGTIVGKAVEIVSSAGAFLGLWQHGGTDDSGP